MKRIFRSFTILLAMSLILTSCAGTDTDETTTVAPVATTTEAENNETEQTDEETEDDAGTETDPETEETQDVEQRELIEYELIFGEHGSQPYTEDTWVIMPWALENFNIQLNMTAIPSSDYQTRLSTTIAGGDPPDILMGVGRDLANEYGVNGMFLNLWDYIDHMPELQQRAEDFPLIKTWMYSENEMYSQPATITTEGAVAKTAYYIPFIREDIMIEAGFTQMPETFEELEEILQGMKDLYPDSYPWINRSNLRMFMNVFAPGLGIDASPMGSNATLWAVWNEDTETFTHIMEEENFRWFLEWMNGLFEKGLIDPNYAADDSSTWESKLVSSQGFFSIDYFARPDMMESAGKSVNPDYTLRAMLTPALEEGEQKIYANTGIGGSNAFSAQVEEPERLAEFLDKWFYSEEGSFLMKYGNEGETYTLNDDKTITAIFGEGVTNQLEYDSAYGVNYLTFYGFQPDFFGYDLYDENLSETYNDTWNTFKDHQTALPPTIIRSPDETEAYQEYSVDLDTVTLNAFHELIMGRRDFSEWDATKDEIDGAGMTEFLEQMNNTYQRLYK